MVSSKISKSAAPLKHKVLLIEDDETFYDSLSLILAECPVEIVWARSGKDGIQLFQNTPEAFVSVVIDYLLPDINGAEVCRHLRRENPEQIFLFTSQYFEKDFLTDQLRAGADGFVDKTRPPVEIRSEIMRAVQTYKIQSRLLGSNQYEKSKAQVDLAAAGMIGRSKSMHTMLTEINSARNEKYPTLIVGETGSGKELVAKALTPSGKVLVAINCASYIGREHMLEAELFGYVKGAFTDAKSDTPGLIAQAHGQVLFLDELHQLPVAAQSKLLRFLQEMRYRRVGDHGAREVAVTFKLLAAVQPDIRERLKDGRFLPDLLERVGALVIRVPALDQRREDIELLVQSFQDEFNEGRQSKDRRQFRISTVTEMQRHPWPTNVRGLKNATLRMLTNCRGDIVNPRDFKEYLDLDLMRDGKSAAPVEGSLEQATRNLETKTIIKALGESRTRVEAAARVGLSLTSFLRRLTKLQINADLFLRQT